MCHQVTYTLPCEHVMTQTIYCADATIVEPTPSSGSGAKSGGSGKTSSSRSKHKSSSSSSSSKPSSKSHHSSSRDKPPSSTSSSPAVQKKRACANLSVQLLPYPMPPSYEADPASFFSGTSLLSPRCPLGRNCLFEQKNRCWNCCWCGKRRNQTGRCSCVQVHEGNQIHCEHICCSECEAAALPDDGTGFVYA